MSAYCIYNIKEHTMSFEEFDSLSKELVQYGVLNNVGFFFHSLGYAGDLIKNEKMQNYFFISDSFLYQNADDLLDAGAIDFVKFKKKYSFFEDIVKILRKYKIQKIEIYISDETENILEFETFETSDNKLIEKLFENIEKKKEEFAGCFYPLKIVLEEENL